MTTIATLFSGGEGASYGARRAGYQHSWGVEYDPKIASVAGLNGFEVLVGDVLAQDFAAFETPYWLHLSPPCVRASQANANASEDLLDIALADACIRALEALRPPRVSLENVWQYRTFEAFRRLLAALDGLGYAVGWWHLNAANYGIPQTRKRLILIASRDSRPICPPQTHHDIKNGQQSLVWLPWNGWYAAIADLIPSLPDSQFAPWQLKRLPGELRTMLVGRNSSNAGTYETDAPAPTLMSSPKSQNLRAFIVNDQFSNDGQGIGLRGAIEPAHTVTTRPAQKIKAFVVDCQDSGAAQGQPLRRADEPMYTLSASMEPRRPARAFIIGGGNTNTTEAREPIPRFEDEPSFTVSGSSNRDRAYVGRVVKLNARCLARLNDLGDDYLLPASPTLACTVLGNMHLLQEAMMRANP